MNQMSEGKYVSMMHYKFGMIDGEKSMIFWQPTTLHGQS